MRGVQRIRGMDGYRVQTAVLKRYAGDFASVQSRLSGLADRMSGVQGGVTGHDDLAAAVRHFADEWEYSIKKIGEHAKVTEEKLLTAAGTYEASDQAGGAAIQTAVTSDA